MSILAIVIGSLKNTTVAYLISGLLSTSPRIKNPSLGENMNKHTLEPGILFAHLQSNTWKIEESEASLSYMVEAYLLKPWLCDVVQ